MHHDYKDITSRISDPPLWWDEFAVPRYSKFSPAECANIYANEVCLLHIECQGCGAAFKVCISRTTWETMETARSLESFVRGHDIHFGDPPNAGCCAAGPTMNSVPRQVLEFWLRGRGKDGETEERNGIRVIKNPAEYMKWKRIPELECVIEPDWWQAS